MNKKTTVDLVVARYDEDVSWLHGVVAGLLEEEDPGLFLRISLYNKGDASVHETFHSDRVTFRQERLPNVGRESHTYLQHVLRERGLAAPSDADAVGCGRSVTVFMQGRMDDHVPAGHDTASFVACLVRQASRPDGSGESDNHACHDRFGSFNAVPRLRVAMYPGVGDSGRDLGTWFGQLIGPWRWADESEGPTWWQNGVFAIRTCRLLSRDAPDNYYEALRSEVDWHVNPEAGHYLERSWCHVFPKLRDGN